MLGKIEGRKRRGRQRTRWLDGITGHEFEQIPGVGDGQGRLACCSPCGHKELDMIEQLNSIDKIYFINKYMGAIMRRFFSCVRLCATQRIVACQALLSIGFSRHEY